MFLVSCFMFCDVLVMCEVPCVEMVLLTDLCWLEIVCSQEGKRVLWGSKARLQSSLSHVPGLHSLIRKARTEPGLVHALLPPYLLREKETAMLSCTPAPAPPAYSWPWVLHKVRPKLLPFFTFMCGNQMCGFTAVYPLACTMTRAGLGPRSFKPAGCSTKPTEQPSCPFATGATASLWPC